MSSYAAHFLILGHIVFLAGSVTALVLRRTPPMARIASCSTAVLGSLSWLVASCLTFRQPVQGTLFRIGFEWTWAWNLDQLSAFFLLVVSIAGFLASIYALDYTREYDPHGGPVLGCAYNLFLLSLGLVLTAHGALPFLLAWEFMSISSLFLVGLDHARPAVRQAAFIYGVITHGATALLTVAFLLLVNIAGADFSNWQALQPTGALYHIVLALFVIGFGSKAGLAPIHVWLPRAHPAAPSHVSALMSGVMVKVAIYGLLRAVFTWLALPSPVWGAILLTLGVISALIGALYALVDQDCKGVLAYSTIENVGLLTAGIGAAILLGPSSAGSLALGFVLLHVVSHATFKTLLFLGAGVVQGSTHTRQLDQLGGLIHRMPKAAGLILVGVLAIASVPPLAGFASEWTLMQTLFALTQHGGTNAARFGGVLGMAAVALTAGLVAAAMVRFYGVVFLGRPRAAECEHANEPSLLMRMPMAILAFGCLVIGLAAQPILRFTQHLATRSLLATTPQITLPQAGAQAGVSAATQETSLSLGVGVTAIALLSVLVLVLVGVVLLTHHYSGRRTPIRRSIPWGCGIDLTPAMQYSALGLAEPARIIFRSLLRLRSVVAKEPGTLSPGRFGLAVPVPGERLLYRPLRDTFVRLADQIRKLQAGSLQLYLGYMLATLVLLLLVAR